MQDAIDATGSTRAEVDAVSLVSAVVDELLLYLQPGVGAVNANLSKRHQAKQRLCVMLCFEDLAEWEIKSHGHARLPIDILGNDIPFVPGNGHGGNRAKVSNLIDGRDRCTFKWAPRLLTRGFCNAASRWEYISVST